MARYLPASYDPIPDALLHSHADLVDAVRRISRNQNWIWANHGNVFAACGQEPMTAQTPSVSSPTSSVDVAYFACPNRSATLSDSVRVRGYIAKPVATFIDAAFVRLYQLLPGESVPTADTPYDEVKTGTGLTTGDIFFEFTARIRSGADPLRFCLRFLGAPSLAQTLSLLTVTVTWLPNPTSVLGESVAAWNAISQGFVTPDRALSAVFLRALSNQTLRLVASNPRPIFTHSFIWPRIRTDILVAETRVALYSARHDALVGLSPRVSTALQMLVTGQGAQVRFRVYINGTFKGTYLPTATTLVEGVYVKEDSGLPVNAIGGGAADMKIEITAETITAATAPPAYCQNVGGVLLGTTFFADLFVTNLGLPGAETVPAAYEPLDDNACAPGSPVVAQNDRLGRRAGPYYLVRNLIWLAANRTESVLIADWTHRTQVPAYPDGAGDGKYRSASVPAGQNDTTPGNTRMPTLLDRIGWVDRPAPTNAKTIANGGHIFRGDVVARFYCRPMNGGQIRAIARISLDYMLSSPSGASRAGFLRGHKVGGAIFFEVDPNNARGDFVAAAPSGPKPAAADILSLTAGTGRVFEMPSGFWKGLGMQIAAQSAYVYEQPLTQGDLDALA